MRAFNYSAMREKKWDSELLGYIAAIYRAAGKQEIQLKQRPNELEKLVEIAKIHPMQHIIYPLLIHIKPNMAPSHLLLHPNFFT